MESAADVGQDAGSGSGPAMFQSFSLRRLQLKNRVAKAATHDGASFEEMRRTYVRLALNDVALITVAYVAVSPVNKTFNSQHHIGADNAEDWRGLCRSVHEAGGRMSAQLHHPGLFCMSDGTPMGPSLFYLPSKVAWPKTMSVEDIQAIRHEFVAAAVLCAQVGFDCVELHCGHGYLLSQFLTPAINRRGDEYGGSVTRRARLPVEIVRDIRAALGDGFPIVVKLNAEDGLPIPGGLQLEEALEVAKLLAAASADAIIPSFGYTSLNGFGMLRGGVPLQKMADGLPGAARWIVKAFGPYLVPQLDFEPLFLRTLAKRFVTALDGTSTSVMYVGGADSFQNIEDVLRDGCVAVQLGRPLIREPFFLRRIKAEIGKAGDGRASADVASKCIRCNMCTLASIDPVRYRAGCPFLRPGEGRDIEDIEAMPRL